MVVVIGIIMAPPLDKKFKYPTEGRKIGILIVPYNSTKPITGIPKNLQQMYHNKSYFYCTII